MQHPHELLKLIEAIKKCRMMSLQEFKSLRGQLCYLYLSNSITFVDVQDFIRRILWGRHETLSTDEFESMSRLRRNRDKIMWYYIGSGSAANQNSENTVKTNGCSENNSSKDIRRPLNLEGGRRECEKSSVRIKQKSPAVNKMVVDDSRHSSSELSSVDESMHSLPERNSPSIKLSELFTAEPAKPDECIIPEVVNTLENSQDSSLRVESVHHKVAWVPKDSFHLPVMKSIAVETDLPSAKDKVNTAEQSVQCSFLQEKAKELTTVPVPLVDCELMRADILSDTEIPTVRKCINMLRSVSRNFEAYLPSVRKDRDKYVWLDALLAAVSDITDDRDGARFARDDDDDQDWRPVAALKADSIKSRSDRVRRKGKRSN